VARAVDNLLRRETQGEEATMSVPCLAAPTEVQPCESLRVPLL